MNKKYTIAMIVALLAVLAVATALIMDWLRSISDEDIADAVMEAAESDAGGVALNSTFTLDFDSDVSYAAVRRCLSVEPEIEMGLHQGSSHHQVLVVPAEPLSEDTLYTFTLTGEDTASGWAFQTTAPVGVISCSPEDHSTVDPGRDISFTLDRLLYADLSAIDDYFTVSPELSGRFEQQGRQLVFHADSDFAPGQVYQVQLKAGLPFIDTSAVLADDVDLAFAVKDAAPTWSLSGDNFFLSGNSPSFSVRGLNGYTLPTGVQIKLYSLDTADYIDLLCDISAGFPVWSGRQEQISGCDLADARLLTTAGG